MKKEDAIPGKTIIVKGKPKDYGYNSDMFGKTYVISPAEMQQSHMGSINVLGAPTANGDGGYYIDPSACELVKAEEFYPVY